MWHQRLSPYRALRESWADAGVAYPVRWWACKGCQFAHACKPKRSKLALVTWMQLGMPGRMAASPSAATVSRFSVGPPAWPHLGASLWDGP
jgi:hypothetical protein